MAGYLANYGAGEEQRERTIRRLIITAVVLARWRAGYCTSS